MTDERVQISPGKTPHYSLYMQIMHGRRGHVGRCPVSSASNDKRTEPAYIRLLASRIQNMPGQRILFG